MRKLLLTKASTFRLREKQEERGRLETLGEIQNGVKMTNQFKEDLFRLFFVEGKKYQEIADLLNISYSIVSSNYCKIKQQFSDDYLEVRRMKTIYSNKKSKQKKDFKFKDFSEFYDWLKKQGNTCHYCKTEQSKITKLIYEGLKNNPLGISSKRFNKRGRSLEIDRKDPLNAEYSIHNCVLACYFCNNDKSDIYSEKEYLENFKEALKERYKYINKKYSKLI